MRQDRAILQVRAFPKGQKGESLDLSQQVMSFSLTDHSAKADRITLTVKNDDLRNFDNPVWRRGVILEVTWGYPGLMDSRRCIIKKIRGGVKLTVEAHALSSVMNLRKKCRTWENTTLGDLAKKIEFEYASILYYEDSVRKDPNLRTLGDNLQIIHAVQAAETDAQFLARLAKKYGLIFRVNDQGKIYFGEANHKLPPVRTLTWRGGRGDWEDFEVQNDPAGRLGAVTMKAVDPAAKKEVEHRADNASTKRAGLASVVEVIDARTGIGHYEERTASESVESATLGENGKQHLQAKAEGRFKASQRGVVKLWGRCVGDPRLAATRLIVAEGLRKLVSGRYRLVETWHDIDEKGKYTTAWVGKSDGSGGYGDSPNKNVESKASKNSEQAVDSDEGKKVERVEVINKRTGQGHYEFRQRGR